MNILCIHTEHVCILTFIFVFVRKAQVSLEMALVFISSESSGPSRYSEKALKSSDEKETYLINFMNKIKLRQHFSVVFCPYTAHLSGFLLEKNSTNQIFFYVSLGRISSIQSILFPLSKALAIKPNERVYLD